MLQAPKFITHYGAKLIGLTVSAETGQLVTFEGIITEEGKALPPPEGCLGLANPSGWVNSANFLEVVKNIQALTLSSKGVQCLFYLTITKAMCL